MALIDIRDLTFAYPGSYDNVFEHLSLQLDTHWRLGLVGRNGRGKTTLLRLRHRQYELDGVQNGCSRGNTNTTARFPCRYPLTASPPRCPRRSGTP